MINSTVFDTTGTDVFIAVNYNTSFLICKWVSSIRKSKIDAVIILVDNFSTIAEREKSFAICERLNIVLLCSENFGYGRALNFAFQYVHDSYDFDSTSNVVIYAGNLDIEYDRVPHSLPKGNYAYLLRASESGRDRNPFLTIFQSRLLPLHSISLRLDSLIWFRLVIALLKLASVIPSDPWTSHGSLFCINYDSLIKKRPIFDAESFLYSEELEFGDWLGESPSTPLIKCLGVYEHNAHAATKSINSNTKEFFALWKPSFSNWLKKH